MKPANTIFFRDAVRDDALFIARCILAAVGEFDFSDMDRDSVQQQIIMEDCSMDRSLYSYTHTRIAECDGKPVGCLLSYPGEEYAELRKATWDRIDRATGRSYSSISDTETGAGEYYLDSLAVIPEYRGQGIGRRLFDDSIQRAMAMGYNRITLIVEKDHPKLIEYYKSMGFEPESELIFLGERYVRCALDTARQ